MLTNATPIALISVLLIVTPVHAAIIDDFSVGEVQLLGPSETVNQTSLDPSSVIGGARRIAVDQNAMNLSISPGLTAKRTGDLGYFTLMYGFDGPLGANFKQNGHDRLRLKFSADGSENAGGIFWASINTSLPPRSDAPGPNLSKVREGGIVEIPFTQYGANLTQVSTFAIQVVRMSGGFTLESIETAGPPLAGDFDRNGIVGPSDLHEFGRTFGNVTIPQEGFFAADANLDRRVDGRDYLIWQREFNQPTNSTATRVPEPVIASYLAAVAGLLSQLHGSRRLPRPQE
jgi:hypothetical protein